MPKIKRRCLDEDTMLMLIVGRLSLERLAEVDHHLQLCDPCRVVVAAVAESLQDPPSHGTDGIRVKR